MLARKTPYCSLTDSTTKGSVCQKVRDVLDEPWPSRYKLGPNRRDIMELTISDKEDSNFRDFSKASTVSPFPQAS